MKSNGWITRHNESGAEQEGPPVVEAPPAQESPAASEGEQEQPAEVVTPPAEPSNSELEALREQFNRAVGERDSLSSQVTELNNKLAEMEKNMGQENVDLDAVTNALKEQFNTDLAAVKSDLEEKVRKSELKAFTERAIREAGNELLPELVRGDSEEEVLAAIEASKNRYKEIAEAALKNATPAAPQGGVVPPPSPAAAVPPAAKPEGGGTSEVTLDAVESMSMADYEANRETLRKQAAAQFLNKA